MDGIRGRARMEDRRKGLCAYILKYILRTILVLDCPQLGGRSACGHGPRSLHSYREPSLLIFFNLLILDVTHGRECPRDTEHSVSAAFMYVLNPGRGKDTESAAAVTPFQHHTTGTLYTSYPILFFSTPE